MKTYLLGGLRFLVVTIGIVVLTSLSIDATQYLSGSQSALGIFARNATEASCPESMVELTGTEKKVCLDKYEVTPGKGCIFSLPQNSNDTASNANNADCEPESTAKAWPWTHVAIMQAKQLCGRVGKRLPTSDEWYLAAVGTPDDSKVCNTQGGLRRTSTDPQCVSGVGSIDMVGNVWEWVDGEVVEGKMGDIALPPEGYVAAVSDNGLPTQSTTSPQVVYNQDYVWSSTEGTKVVMRGGFHGSRGDAGVYSTHANLDQAFESAAVGFRCALTL